MMDTLQTMKNLKAAGFDEAQAETLMYMYIDGVNAGGLDTNQAVNALKEVGFDEIKAQAVVTVMQQGIMATRDNPTPSS